MGTSLTVGIAVSRTTPDGWSWCVCVSLQLQKHDREDQDVPSKWRTEEEMARAEQLAQQANDNRKMMDIFGK